MKLEAIKKAPIETIGVLFWWVNNQGKFLINKPIIDIALKYLDLSKIKILKIVSDHMNIMDWSNLNIRKLIQSNIESISSIIKLNE
ncbi:MAG: hypothetical protein VX260_03445, partial [Candidatus Neomarinimicrobiota bacterium]|nr:hypothetical protein [Candidatus Neomarinimicrobiota bacterium]